MCSAKCGFGDRKTPLRYDAFAIAFADAIRIEVATFFPSFGKTLTLTRSPSFRAPPVTRVAAVQVIAVCLPLSSFSENVFAF